MPVISMSPTAVFIYFILLCCIFFIPPILFYINFSIKYDREEKRKIAEYEQSDFCKQTRASWKYMQYDKGVRGEYETYEALKSFENEEFRFLFHLYIPTRDNRLTEIDMIAITTRGIIVIENKNFKGTISGDEYDYDWYQTFHPRNGKIIENQMQNPIIQNANHIKHLRNIIGPRIRMHSLIVFSDNCKLRDVVVKTDQAQVVHKANACKTVERILQGSTASLEKNGIDKLYNQLLPYTQVTQEIKERHLSQFKK